MAFLGCIGFGLGNVGFEEKLTEEHKVAEVHKGRPHNVLHVRRALLALLHPRIHQVVDHATHHHLSDLRQSDEHGKLAGDFEAGGPQSVVGIHNGMNQVVHGHEPTTAGHHVLIGVPGIQQYCNVVIPMQED